MAKTHPHIDSPTTDQLLEVYQGRDATLVQTCLAFHEVILDSLPDIRFSIDTVDGAIGYAEHQYGYSGWGMLALTPFTKWVSLTVMQGSKLDDPKQLLSGTAVMRHIKFTTPEQVHDNRSAIGQLLIQASQLYTDAK